MRLRCGLAIREGGCFIFLFLSIFSITYIAIPPAGTMA